MNQPTVAPDTLWTLKYPELGTAPIPVEPCISTDYFDLERERIFKRVWLNVGRVEEVPAPGDYRVQDIPACDASVLWVRQKDGAIRAFHNVCSHRMNRVATAAHGNARAFACGFHGWVYGLDGRLIEVPDEDRFFGLDKSTCGLTPLPCEVWNGFVFVNLTDPAPESLESFLGTFLHRFDGYPFADLTACYAYDTVIRANWKVAIDAFIEGYHVGFVHRRSVGGVSLDASHPVLHAEHVYLDARHQMLSNYASPDFRPSPTQGICFGLQAGLTQGRADPASLPPGVNPGRSPNWLFDVNRIFPNFFVDVSVGWYLTYNFWPVSVDETRYHVRMYYAPPRTAGQRFAQEYFRCELRDTLYEDLSIIERIQANLRAGVKREMHLQDEEIMVRHSYKVVEDYVGHYPPERSPFPQRRSYP